MFEEFDQDFLADFYIIILFVIILFIFIVIWIIWETKKNVKRSEYIIYSLVVHVLILSDDFITDDFITSDSIKLVLGVFISIACLVWISKTAGRLLDLRWSRWWTLIGCLPYVSYAFTIFLCIKDRKPSDEASLGKSA